MIILLCFFVFVVLFTLCVGLSRVDSGTPGGFSNDGGGGGSGGGAGPQQSVPHGVSLSLSTADATPAGSPDPSSLTVLQPANNNQNNGTVYAAAASTMLPGFTTHYGTTGKSKTRRRAITVLYGQSQPRSIDLESQQLPAPLEPDDTSIRAELQPRIQLYCNDA